MQFYHSIYASNFIEKKAQDQFNYLSKTHQFDILKPPDVPLISKKFLTFKKIMSI